MGFFLNMFNKNNKQIELKNNHNLSKKVEIDIIKYQKIVDTILQVLDELGYGSLMLEKIKYKAIGIIKKGINNKDIKYIENKLNKEIIEYYTSQFNKLKNQTESKIKKDPINREYYISLLKLKCGYSINIDFEINKWLKIFAEAGYSILFLEQFKKEMLEIVKNKISSKLTFETNIEIFNSLEKYGSKKILLIEKNRKYNQKKHSEDSKKEWNQEQFYQFNYVEEIDKWLGKLKKAGYGDELLKKYKKTIFETIDDKLLQIPKNSDISKILYGIIERYFKSKLLEINRSRKLLQEKILEDEINKDYYQRQFDIKFGYSFDYEEEIEKKLVDLSDAGYGDILLKEYKKTILETLQKRKIEILDKKSNLQIFNQINDFFNIKLVEIMSESEKLKDVINQIMNKEMSEKEKVFEILYSDNILHDRQRLLVEIYKNKFQIKFGNDVLADYVKNSMCYLKTYGFSEQTINDEFDKFLKNYHDIQKTTKKIQQITSIMRRDNNELLLLLVNNNSMNEIANIYYGNINSGNGFLLLKEILSTYNESRKKIYHSIDESINCYIKNNSDFVINNKLGDKTQYILNLESDKPFTQWLQALKYDKQLGSSEMSTRHSNK